MEPLTAGTGQTLARLWQARPGVVLGICGWLLLWLSHVLIFTLTTPDDGPGAAYSGLINVGPAALLGLGVAHVLQRHVLHRPMAVHALAHPPLAVAFALVWYLALITGLGGEADWLGKGFTVTPFRFIPVAWQMFQGLMLYAIVALFCYASWFRTRLMEHEAGAFASARDAPAPDPALGAARRIFVRQGDEIVALEAESIVRISGAGDYSEVTTTAGRFLSNSALSVLEERLSGTRFLRVHPSHIINLDAVERAEPDGNGRLSLHMADGETITASRAGTKAFRTLSI